MKYPITGLFPQEIVETFALKQRFRGEQIFSWIAKGAVSFDDMTNLSLSMRETLSSNAELFTTEITQKQEDDYASKLQIKLNDGSYIECVLLVDAQGRKTACLSTQVGCAMGCAFCKTGTLGLLRNLEAHEIMEQYLHLRITFGEIDTIVFMGMGEPLANLDNLKKSIALLTHPKGFAMSPRRITVSTCGLASKIEELSETGVKLAVSLISADPDIRESIMPVTKGNPLPRLKSALQTFQEKTKKRFTLEVVLIKGKTDRPGDIKKLKTFVKGLNAIINIIPWNPITELPFEEPTETSIRGFISELERAGLTVTRRISKGRKIGGACGQLGKIKKEFV